MLYQYQNEYGAISMNVLIVDNEIVQVENLRIGLSSRGYHVLQALSGHEALDLIEDDALEIDLVITDYAMPGINGIELLQNIRWRHGDLPVILMTAYGERDIVLDALRNHCNGFIDKPFTLDNLLHEIDRVRAAADPSATLGISGEPRQNKRRLPIVLAP